MYFHSREICAKAFACVVLLISLWRQRAAVRGQPGMFGSFLPQNAAPDTRASSLSEHTHFDILNTAQPESQVSMI